MPRVPEGKNPRQVCLNGNLNLSADNMYSLKKSSEWQLTIITITTLTTPKIIDSKKQNNQTTTKTTETFYTTK
jgi:hypothetical protein